MRYEHGIVFGGWNKLKIQMHSMVLGYEGWLWTRFIPYEARAGYGKKHLGLHLPMVKYLQYLFPHRKDLTIFTNSTGWGKMVTVQVEMIVNTNPFDIHRMITRTFQREEK